MHVDLAGSVFFEKFQISVIETKLDIVATTMI